MRHIVIGTAGHVDHGKTALVRALTGVETDRLAEERRRGITIELGFAPCRLDDVDAGIVDVPGHEDFVRMMVAGATGIDVALLVIAADEGVMPQTREHAAILGILGVPVGVVALTKTDLVDADWLALVRADVEEQLRNSPTRWAAVVDVSGLTGAGISELRAALGDAAREARARRADDLFRLPVDRVFSVAGAGTVVTGTVWSGSVPTGGEVLLLPGGHRGRIRGIQSHGKEQAAAEPGRRTALALTGVDRAAAARGTMAVAGPGWRTTEALDVHVTMLPDAPPLGQRTRVRVHLGTAEVMARVTPAGDPVGPGASGTVRLRLEGPLAARWGDRLVLRSYSPATTIGGAVVADPWPPARPRRPTDVRPLLAAPDDRLAAAVARAGEAGVSTDSLPVRLGVPPGDVPGLLAAVVPGRCAMVGDRLLPPTLLAAAAETVVHALEAFHRRARFEPGMPKDQLRRAVDDPAVADAVMQALEGQGTIVADGPIIRLAGHEVRLDAADAAAVQEVRNALEAAGFEGKAADDVVSPAGTPSRTLLEHLVRSGAAVRIGSDRFVSAGIIEKVVGEVRAALAADGTVGPSQLRDRIGLTRKFSIPLLEWMDAQGFTVRQGDVRVPGPRLTGGSDRP